MQQEKEARLQQFKEDVKRRVKTMEKVRRKQLTDNNYRDVSEMFASDYIWRKKFPLTSNLSWTLIGSDFEINVMYMYVHLKCCKFIWKLIVITCFFDLFLLIIVWTWAQSSKTECICNWMCPTTQEHQHSEEKTSSYIQTEVTFKW